MATPSRAPVPRTLPSYDVVKAVSSTIPDCLEIFDFIAGCCSQIDGSANENSNLSFEYFHQRPNNTALRWIQLKSNARSTFQRLTEPVNRDEVFQNLFLGSPYRFGIWKYGQDYSESCCIVRTPETGYSNNGSTQLDPQLAIYLPYFKWSPSGASIQNTPLLADFAHPSIIHSDPTPKSKGSLPLAVHQVWVFVTGSKTVVSFIPQEPENSDSQLDVKLEDVILKAVPNANAAPKEIDVVADAYLMAAHIIRSACLLQMSGPLVKTPLVPYLEQVVASLSGKRFEAYELFSRSIDGGNFGQPKPQDRHLEFHLLLEAIKTVEELESFQFVLTSQATVVRQMLKAYKDNKSSSRSVAAERLLSQTQQDLLMFQSSLGRLSQNATTIQAQILQLLDLKQKEANLSEVEYARLRAEEAATQTQITMEQGRTILLFTIVAIIFLPLSFFTSYFGMNVAEISGNPQNVSQAYFWKISGPITVAIILVSMVVAFNKKTRDTLRQIRKGLS